MTMFICGLFIGFWAGFVAMGVLTISKWDEKEE